MASRISRLLLISSAVIASQIFCHRSVEADWKRDKSEWMKICNGRFAEYNQMRVSNGYKKWNRKKAEEKCGYAWAVARPSSHDARHLIMIREADSECFLTSVCCEAIGLPDDCLELNVLRKFRDNILLKSSEGAEEVAVYYTIAPFIAQSLRASGDRVYARSLYFLYVLPCVILIMAGFKGRARSLYHKMVVELLDEHGRSPLHHTASANPHLLGSS